MLVSTMHIIIIEKKIIFHRFWRNFSVNSCSKESLFQGVREIPPWWIPPIESPRKLPLVHSLNYRLAKFHPPPPRWIPTGGRFRVRVRGREFDQVGIYRGGGQFTREEFGQVVVHRGGAEFDRGNWPGGIFLVPYFRKRLSGCFHIYLYSIY